MKVNEMQLKKYLESCAMDEFSIETTLSEHDKRFHPNGYKEGDRCTVRDKLKEKDEADRIKDGLPSGLNTPLTKKDIEIAEYEEEYEEERENAKKMTDAELESELDEIRSDVWAEGKDDFCEALGRPDSEYDDYQSEYGDEIDEVARDYYPRFSAYADELESRQKSAR